MKPREKKAAGGDSPPLAVGKQVCWFMVLFAGLLAGLLRSQPSAGEGPKPSGSAAADRPVILLTGFEPFGEGRPANSSWEGIKALDGRDWHGYRLVARQMHVAWGSPLAELQTWIAAYRPVAIFSFGQGAPGAFAIESRAANARGNAADNNGQRPPSPTIVAGGPNEVRATIDHAKLSQALTKKGYPARVSDQAGAYLCEETLY
jgi:pyroglutamyl-peptidase